VQTSAGAPAARAYAAPAAAPEQKSLLKTIDMSKVRIAPGAKQDPRHMPTVRRMAPPAPPTAAELAAWAAEQKRGYAAASLPAAPKARPLLGLAILGGMAVGLAIVGLLAARSRGGPSAAAPSASAPVAAAASAPSAPPAATAPAVAPASASPSTADSTAAAPPASAARPPARPAAPSRGRSTPELLE
jgi:hypothetical protein